MPAKRTDGGRVFWGLLLILMGVLFLLDQMGRLNFGDIMSTYWPVIIILVGLSTMIGSGFRRIGGGLFLVLLGTFFQLRELGILREDIWHYAWPALIILVGIWILFGGIFRHRTHPAFPVDAGSDMDVTAILSGQDRRFTSAGFKGGHATAVMGGAEIDLTEATLEGGKATVELTAIMGGIDLRVPRDWKVVIDATPILGGVSDSRKNIADADAKSTLYIKATAILGGVEIKS
ncbi:MAG: DUF5668 domain-containing protein [Candidatus Aminicenantes bacterium]|nr:DUF5668 domain-containing protein [Candidatus Aminicenantes bacterium]